MSNPVKQYTGKEAFNEGWTEVVKAAPCPLCGAKSTERCMFKGSPRNHSANRCSQRRRAMERGFLDPRRMM